MCSFAIVQLGLSKDEFFELTPREFVALKKQHEYKTRHTELLTAIIATSIVNTGMCRPEKPLPFSHFMPSEWSKQPAKTPRKKRLTKDDIETINRSVHCFFAARSDNPPPRTPEG
jgi:hypothetical protein